MSRSDIAVRWTGALLAVSVSIAALSSAWAMTTRTTSAGPGAVYRENLLTGQGRFCVGSTLPNGQLALQGGCQPSAPAPLNFLDRGRLAP